MRPLLKPALRRVRRGPGVLQLGLTPAHAVVLQPAGPETEVVLDLLDGTRSWAAVPAAAADRGVPADVAVRLLDLLRSGGALGDGAADPAALRPLGPAGRARLAPDLASLSLLHDPPSGPAAVLGRRREAVVEVQGGGRVGSQVAALLAAAAVGEVRLVDERPVREGDLAPGGWRPGDRGRRRTAAGVDLVRRCGPTGTGDGRSVGTGRLPDLVVLAPAALGVARRCVADGVAHLCVEVVETTAVVGPLVLPGRGPCTDCVDQERQRWDGGWPSVAVTARAGAPRGGDPCDVVLATAAAATAAGQVLALLDVPAGETDGPAPATVGGTLELTLPDWRWRRRSWPTNPSCACVVGSPAVVARLTR